MLISIITINYNNKQGLERTLKSVQTQTFNDYELIVIDGNSTDGSKHIIEQYKTDLNYYVSEPDTGIYNAMNKGIKQAKGNYLFFLNSGDNLVNDSALAKVAKYLSGEGFVYFNINRIKNNKKWVIEVPSEMSFFYLHNDTIPHQSIFIKKELFNTVGAYDEHLKLVSDWKFIITALIKYNASYKHVNEVFSNFYEGGVSSSKGSFEAMEKERQLVLKQDFPLLLNDLKYKFKLERTLRTLRKSRKINWLIKLGLINKF
ncbi:glycosyltransferase family 2 protein [Neotamlana laminarinivorans]|uniref:Glycosyltransferase n=1 Tax=Neotamlana laminarinivorans TaxID=2883124 RepID=A0A9X1L4T4_9FLAO|nr:glycosyltransferase family 2 protein [Tamlana laminarinivorans]MCB4799692.1 glycosyltransferase [Tamlana laminarinivorans]